GTSAGQLDAAAVNAEQNETVHLPILGQRVGHSLVERRLQHRYQLVGPPPQDLRKSLIGCGKLLLSAREADRYPAHRTEPLSKSLFARPSPQQRACDQRLGRPSAVSTE